VSVQVLTDLAPVTQFDEIVVLRDGVPRSHVVSNRERYDSPRVVLEYRDVVPGTVLELAAELRLHGETVLRRTRRTTVRGSQIVLFTFTASCRELRCPMGDPAATECLGGRCVVPGCSGEGCVVAECEVHADCVPRSSCESPRCVDGVCFQFADPALCAQTEVCVATMGCQPRLPDPDGGVLDAAVVLDVGPDDGSVLDAGPSMPPNDAGHDVGVVLDVGTRDGGGLDAGRDAGALDAGLDGGDLVARSDAGTDAGTDAWVVDCTIAGDGTVCRPSRGPCDPEEVCTKRRCPRDVVSAAGTVCRTARDPCQRDAVCNGTRVECPDNRFLPNDTPCEVGCGMETCLDGRCVGGVSCAPGTFCCSDRSCSALRCD
jgi:hypothetical protein